MVSSWLEQHVERAGLPKEAWMNFTKSPSLLLFVGAGVYVLVDAFARAVIMGNLTCHSDLRLSL